MTMNKKQLEAAQKAMVRWLAHPNELGREPERIECAGTFDLHEMHYYYFKYRKGPSAPWLLGVCGGYEGDGLEHCGHVFSRMEEYDEATAVEQATALVEQVREYWMNEAKRWEERGAHTGLFVGFVLLKEAAWDKDRLLRDLGEKWGVDVKGETSEGGIALGFSADGLTVGVVLVPAPMLNDEAVEGAEFNYFWPGAVEAAKAHKAHLVVTVAGSGKERLLERGKLLVKVLACCCGQENATGVYTSGVVFEPEFYADLAEVMKDGRLPVMNWIWFGLYPGEKGFCCYTFGMDVFGKDEMEVLDVDAEPADLRAFLSGLAVYVLENDVVLNDGETIGFSEDDKHAITRSKGVSLPGMTLKIAY